MLARLPAIAASAVFLMALLFGVRGAARAAAPTLDLDTARTTVIADAVNAASRMEGLTKLFGAKIIVSESIVSSLEDPERYRLRSLGRVQVKGASHDLEIFEVFDADSPELILLKLQSLEVFSAGIDAYSTRDLVKAESLFAKLSNAAPHDRVAVHFAQRCRELATLGSLEAWDGIEHLEVK